MTYAELVIAIQDTCVNNSTQFNAHINDFIITTEDRVFQAISGPLFWKRTDGTDFTVNGTREYRLPSGVLDVLSVRAAVSNPGIGSSMTADTTKFILRKDVEFLKEAYPGPDAGTGSGEPKYYAVTSASVHPSALSSSAEPVMSIMFGPVPNSNYKFEIEYMSKLSTDSITSGSTVAAPLGTQTWLSLAFPDVLLWGSVVQAYTFMKGEQDVMAMYEKQFNEGLLLLKNTVESKQTGDTFAGQSQGNG